VVSPAAASLPGAAAAAAEGVATAAGAEDACRQVQQGHLLHQYLHGWAWQLLHVRADPTAAKAMLTGCRSNLLPAMLLQHECPLRAPMLSSGCAGAVAAEHAPLHGCCRRQCCCWWLCRCRPRILLLLLGL
jgi:hypothetical protein